MSRLCRSDTNTFHATADTAAMPHAINPALGTRARVKFFNEGRAVDDELATLLLPLVLADVTA